MGLTNECVKYILDFYDNNKKFNQFLKHCFPPDELYFHSIIYNSPFAKNTVDGKAIEYKGIQSLCNLTYFEYPDIVKEFYKEDEYDRLIGKGFLYVRKVNSKSSRLIEKIDKNFHTIYSEDVFLRGALKK